MKYDGSIFRFIIIPDYQIMSGILIQDYIFQNLFTTFNINLENCMLSIIKKLNISIHIC